MNNENKDQNNINTNLNVPKDLLTIVNHSTPQNTNVETPHIISSNKFIIDNNFTDLNQKVTNDDNTSNNTQAVNPNQSVIPIVSNNTFIQTPTVVNNTVNATNQGVISIVSNNIKDTTLNNNNSINNNVQTNNLNSTINPNVIETPTIVNNQLSNNNTSNNIKNTTLNNNNSINNNVETNNLNSTINPSVIENPTIVNNQLSINNASSNIKNTTLNLDNSINNNQINNLNDINVNTTYGYKANPMDINTLMKNTYNSNIELEKKTTKSNKWFFITSIGSGICFAMSLFLALFSGGINFSFRGSEPYFQNKTNENLREFETVVVTDNIVTNANIKDAKDAKELIVKDSDNQKVKCSNTKVKQIESRIEKNYGIVAVNLCEMDYKLAKEIEKVLEKIHKEFPSTIKGRLTNLTLSNKGEGEAYAWFTAAKLFAKSNTFTTYPNVYKTSISLNAYYFLNSKTLEAEMKMQEGSYFVANSTGSTLIAHEFGHYLSFIAQLNNSKNISDVILLTQKNRRAYSNLINDSNEGVFSLKIIKEAYNNYNKKNKGKYSDLYEFRASISEYAVATDYYGEYIYDETIAEAFHDYYVNGKNATAASKEIVSVLKKYINK